MGPPRLIVPRHAPALRWRRSRALHPAPPTDAIATSLRTRFVALFLAAGALVASVTFLVFDRATRGIAHHFAAQYAAREALLQQSRVAALVERELALALKLADDPALRRWAQREQDPALAAAARAELESYARAFRSGRYFVALAGSRTYYVYDDVRAAVRTTALHPDAPSDAWFFEALRSNRDHALNVDVNTTLDAVKVWVNVLVRDDAGRPIGVGGTGIDLSDFLAGLQGGAGEARTALVDEAGVIEAHWDRALVERNARAGAGPRTTIYDLVPPEDAAGLRAALAAAGRAAAEAPVITLRLGGRPYLAAAAYMRDIGWYDLVLVDAGRPFSRRALLPLLLAMVAAVGVLLAGLVLTLDRWLLGPIARLTGAARAVAGGDYRVEVPDRRGDELGVLARSFNAMTATVLEYTERLQQKVEERTRQLADSNAALVAAQGRMEESLRYAQAIQATVLPPPERLAQDLGPHALLYLPRDQVGGDFYHHAAVEGGSLTLVVDCTGHGVPGAFVSMTASATLRHVLEGGAADPGDVLARLCRGVRQARHGSEVRGALDVGLDVAACRLDHRSRTVTLAAAGLPVFLVEGGVVTAWAGDRQRVGYRGSDPDHRFRTRVLSPADGARVYLVTDGVLDHAGGEKGFGLGAPRLGALLASLAGVPMDAQAARIAAALRAWAGPHPQRDDLTLIGLEIRWRSPSHVRA